MSYLEAITLGYQWCTHRQIRTNCDKQTQLNVGDDIPDFAYIGLHLNLVVLALDRPRENPFLTHAFQLFSCLVKTAEGILKLSFRTRPNVSRLLETYLNRIERAYTRAKDFI